MIHRRIIIVSVAAFLLSAGVSVSTSREGTSVSLGASATAQPIGCFYRCTGGDAECRSACSDNRGECGQSGYVEALCAASYEACTQRCATSRTRCERACL